VRLLWPCALTHDMLLTSTHGAIPSQAPPLNRRVMILGALFLFAVLPAAAKEKPYRAEGARVLVMVAQLASRDETLATGDHGALGLLKSQGIRPEEIRDGTVAVGIVYCCGGKISKETRLMFYSPPEIQLAVGDVAEMEFGRKPDKKHQDRGKLNKVVAVRESFEDESGACRWDPEDDKLWMRVLYCDWHGGNPGRTGNNERSDMSDRGV
jgi:hypothetical protein